jgi:hypothetical protein
MAEALEEHPSTRRAEWECRGMARQGDREVTKASESPLRTCLKCILLHRMEKGFRSHQKPEEQDARTKVH